MNGHTAALMICLMLVAGFATAQNPPEPTPLPDPAAPIVQTADAGDPCMAEIRAVMDQEQVDIRDLVALLDHTVGHAEQVALQKRIAEVKMNAEVAMLQVQLKYARSANNTEAVSRLEASIALILDPELRRVPQQGSNSDEAGARR